MTSEEYPRFGAVLGSLDHWALVQPEHTAFAVWEGASRSYRELAARVGAVAAQLEAEGLRGARALLLYPPGLDFVEGFLGCLAAGVVAVPALPARARKLNDRSGARLLRLIEDARPEVALTTEAERPHVAHRALAKSGLRWLATDRAEAAGRGTWQAEPEDVAFLQYTSGSTSTPKGVVVGHGNLAANRWALGERLGLGPGSRNVSWLPLHHDMGLIGSVLLSVYRGFSTRLLTPQAFVRRPRVWLEAISADRATVSGAPNFAYDLCVRAISPHDREGLDLSSWECAYCGSEPVRAETLRRFAEAFAGVGFREGASRPVYGLAEATLFAAGGPPGLRTIPSPEGGAPWVGLGEASPDHALRIVDPEGLVEVGPGELGEVWLRGPSVTRGYWGRPEETEAVFGAELEGERWLRTGDLGRVVEGELVVTGRLKELIVVAGRNVFPGDVEATATAAHDALEPGGCVAFGVEEEGTEAVVLVAEVRRVRRRDVEVEGVVGAVREAVVLEHEVGVKEVVLVRPGAVPRTTSGKLRRGEARRRYVEGEWEALRGAARARDPRWGVLEEELRGVLGVGVTLGEGRTLEELGVDSLSRTELRLRLRARWGVEVDVEPTTTVGELVGAGERSEQRPVEEAEEGPVPLTPAAHELLVPGEGVREHGVLLYLRVPARVGWDRAEAALRVVVGRHDAFGVRAVWRGGWEGRYVKGGERGRCTRRDARGEDRALVAEVHRTLFDAIDLERGPLVHAVALDRGPLLSGTWVVGLHHLAFDALSLPLLFDDLQRAVAGEALGSAPSAVGWARRLGRWASESARVEDVARWEAALAGVEPFVWEGERRQTPERVWSAEESRRFVERFPTVQARHDAVLATLARAWREVTGQAQVSILLERHGRGEGGAPWDAVGWWVERYPLPLRLGAEPKDDLAAVERAQAALPSGGSYGALRYLAGELGVLPGPALEFVYRGRIDQAERGAGSGSLRLLGARQRTTGRRSLSLASFYLVQREGGFGWSSVVPEGPTGRALERRVEEGLRQQLC